MFMRNYFFVKHNKYLLINGDINVLHLNVENNILSVGQHETNIGAAVGGVVAAILVIVIIVLLVVFMRKFYPMLKGKKNRFLFSN